MELKLNIYKGKEVSKTYTCDTYNLCYGIVEDLIDIVDLAKINENTEELASLVIQAIKQIKPLLKDVFEGLTDEELRNTHVNEIISVVVEILKGSVSDIKGMFSGRKNVGKEQ